MKRYLLLFALTCAMSSSALSQVAVKITSPASGSTVASSVKLSASATSSSQITGWRVYVDSTNVYYAQSVTSISPTLTLSPGTHRITVRAWAGSLSGDATATVTVPGAAAPVVTVASPVSGTQVSSPMTLRATASSASPISAWRVYVDSTSAFYAPGPSTSISPALSLTAGTHVITVRAWANGVSGSSKLTVTVPSSTALQIKTSSLPSANINSEYTSQLLASGGTAPYSWTRVAGVLPPGLSLSAAGVISGRPSATGQFTFSAQVKDSGAGPQAATSSFSISVIASTPKITQTSCAAGTLGVPYTSPISIVGGSAPYSWYLSSGQLPAGLSLSPTTGTISGTPTVAGSFTFSVGARDSAGATALSPQMTIAIQEKTTSRRSRGYVTTPSELATIAQKSAQGLQPYKDAVLSIKNFANMGSSSISTSPKNASYWPYGTISGSQSCSATLQPSFIGNGSPLIQAKAMTYRITGDADYAADVRKHLLDLTDTTGFGGETYSGGNQCILNLSWYLPGWIIAADLIEDYSGWTAADKKAFQSWLAREMYKKIDWNSGRRSNNWGSAGSATAGMIADYLVGSGVPLVDRLGNSVSYHDAYLKHKQHQLSRMNGNNYMDNYVCKMPGVGLRADGGNPEELGRGSTTCSGLWLYELDSSYTYSMTYLQGTVMHAEFLLRRGDRSIYDNITSSGAGSLKRAIHFLLNNPNDTSKSVVWREGQKQTLEMTYRYYRDSYMGKELRLNSTRYVGGKSGQMLHFGTLTHGFASNENPALPPVTPAP